MLKRLNMRRIFMNKYIYYLIFCSTLLLYCCGEHNPILKGNNPKGQYNPILKGNNPKGQYNPILKGNNPKGQYNPMLKGNNLKGQYSPMLKGNNPTNAPKTTQTSSQTNTNEKTEKEKITSQVDEKQKFNALKSGFDTLFINPNTQEELKTKYQSFIDWLSNHPDKQKELANAFTHVYEFLDAQRIRQSSNLTTEQLLINILNCVEAEDYIDSEDKQRNSITCNNLHVYKDEDKNAIYIIFIYWIDLFDKPYTNNEELFKIIKTQMDTHKIVTN
uniref:Mlp family lipoprotein n=1 Tax=Borrelia miyamotoi TaxID=47466 RepID=A0A5P8AXL2_9SPIR